MADSKVKIGLLGGSFNPAHEGHLHISKEALRILGLDEVWWLVSPQNPLKSMEETAPFEQRMEMAEDMAESIPEIHVSAFEVMEGTKYTYDTLLALKESYPDINFVWLMGADNLVNFHKWHKWKDIFQIMPIAVLDRGEYETAALASEAAVFFKENQFFEEDFDRLAVSTLPAWAFINIEKHPASSTKIRKSI